MLPLSYDDHIGTVSRRFFLMLLQCCETVHECYMAMNVMNDQKWLGKNGQKRLGYSNGTVMYIKRKISFLLLSIIQILYKSQRPIQLEYLFAYLLRYSRVSFYLMAISSNHELRLAGTYFRIRRRD